MGSFGTGLGHFIPLVAYIGFWVMIIASLLGKSRGGLFYAMPFIPYRTMRDKFEIYPLGSNMLTILIIAVIVGAFLQGKRLPKSSLYFLWLIFGVYLYLSMWLGTALGNAPPPIWLSDPNFAMWKDYMLLPLLFVAAGLVIDDRQSVRRMVIILAFSLFLVDRAAILDTLSRSWITFDESKRDAGPLEWGSNQLAAFLAQFGMFFWGFGRVIQRKKVKLICYALVAGTMFATMYTFSRAAYLAVLLAVAILALLKDRKLLLVLPVFLIFWKVVVPAPVTQRVEMTQSADGQLEASAEERVELWENAKQSFYRSPLFGNGYATFQFGRHVDNLGDTHNWYVKVLVETGVVGGIIALCLLIPMITMSYRLFRRARDPLYTALGLGSLLCVVACLVANAFGDRWTYVEITGLLWILLAGVARANDLVRAEAEAEAPQRTVAARPMRLAELR